MTSEDTPRRLSWSPLSSLGFGIPPVFVTSRTSNPARVPSPTTVRRWDETSCFCGRVSGLSARTLSPIASNFPSARHGGARSTCDAASPENWLTALCAGSGRSLLTASLRRGRDRSTTPNLDFRRLKCRSARGVAGAAARPGHGCANARARVARSSSYSMRPNAAIPPRSCGRALYKTRARGRMLAMVGPPGTAAAHYGRRLALTVNSRRATAVST
jgi:hypothetical protein